MAQAYQTGGMGRIAVFELVFRLLQRNRNYIVAVGFHFSAKELDYLRGNSEFSEVNSYRECRSAGS